MSIRHELLQRLADGAFHSGTDLGRQLGVTRAAVHKALQEWSDRGVHVQSVTGRGYRLEHPFVPLSAAAISGLLAEAATRIPLEVLAEVDSTNLHLSRSTGAGPQVCLAESQSAGRGRRGREWLAAPYRNVLLSIRWIFDSGLAELSGLSLAAGVAVARALESFGVTGVQLKWPNDVQWQGRKLAGLLVEVRGEAQGPTQAIVGLGLNVDLSSQDSERIDQPHASLAEMLSRPIDRNRLASALIVELARTLEGYSRLGFRAFQSEWESRHVFHDRPVSVRGAQDEVVGIAVGVDERGALRLRDASGTIRTFHSGEVSMRAATS